MASGLEVAAAGCVGVGNKGGLLALTAIATPTKRALEKRDPPELVPAFVAVPDIADAWSSKRASVNKARGARIHWGSLFGKSQFEGVTDWYQSQGYREPEIMSSATSAVTYTSVYTDSEPGRAFWGADDEVISEGGIPRVIVLGYDGLPIQPAAPPSPDYIPSPEDPQTPPVPQDEDEREPMFVQEHDPDYSNPEEDPKEYEDEETEDGPVDYPMDGGDDGDDDNSDSSGDDADGEDEEDEDEEEEEEHLAPADSAIVVPVDVVGITAPASDFISLFLQRQRRSALARCTNPTCTFITHHLCHHPTTISGWSNPNPDTQDTSLQPLLMRYCRITITLHYTISIFTTTCDMRSGEFPLLDLQRSRIAYGFVNTVDAEERRHGVRDVGYEVNTRVTELAELYEHDTQDFDMLLLELLRIRDMMTLQETVRMVEEEAYASREAWDHLIGLSQATHQELQTHRDHVYAHETHLQAHQTQLQLQGTLIQTQHQAQMVETLRVMRDMRQEMGDMQTELLALRGQRRARQPALDARIPDHQDASGDADSHI
ncbi:hypothetical protein Tco_0103455 [Tanacetum coccineum]